LGNGLPSAIELRCADFAQCFEQQRFRIGEQTADS
jgi:hypothetical protein